MSTESPSIWPPVNYQRRLVFFCDILGWRQRIINAANDMVSIGQLRAIVQMFSVFEHPDIEVAQDAQVSTFSDNIVISIPCDEANFETFFPAIGRVQLGAAMQGFLLRGAVTIGNLFHDSGSVFGPALLRAYDLERRQAFYPCIMLDPNVEELQNFNNYSLIRTDGRYIIDPFNAAFIDGIGPVAQSTPMHTQYWDSMNMPHNTAPPVTLPSALILNHLLQILRADLEGIIDLDAREKINWLINRIEA